MNRYSLLVVLFSWIVFTSYAHGHVVLQDIHEIRAYQYYGVEKYQLGLSATATGGWYYGELVFRAQGSNTGGAVPVYSYVDTNDYIYFYSTNPSESVNGYTKDSTTFYAFDTPLPKTVPVYEYQRSGRTNIKRYSTAETMQDFERVKVAFYAFKVGFELSPIDVYGSSVAPFLSTSVPDLNDPNYKGLLFSAWFANTPNKDNVYSYVNTQESTSKYIYSTDANLSYDSRFVKETDVVLFSALSEPNMNSVPVYQFSDPHEMTVFKYSQNIVEKGFKYDHIAFHVIPVEKQSAPRLVNVYKRIDSAGRIFFTTDSTVHPGWTDGGIAFKAVGNNNAPNVLPVSLSLQGSGNSLECYWSLSQSVVPRDSFDRFDTIFYAYQNQMPDTIPLYWHTRTILGNAPQRYLFSTQIFVSGFNEAGTQFYVYPADYSKYYCFNVLSSAESVCSSHGSCIDTDKCQCNAGWMGKSCNITHCFGYTSTHPGACSGNGSCVAPDRCACKVGYGGHTCQTKIK